VGEGFGEGALADSDGGEAEEEFAEGDGAEKGVPGVAA